MYITYVCIYTCIKIRYGQKFDLYIENTDNLIMDFRLDKTRRPPDFEGIKLSVI